MFEIIKVAVALIGSSVCGLWDLKTTEIPDVLAIAMIVLGIGIHGYESLVIGNLSPLIASLSVVLAFLAFGLFMYYFGYWGGGDGELLVAIGALVPVYPSSFFPFSLSFFINVFLVGAVYSVGYALVIAIRNTKVRKVFMKSVKANVSQIIAVPLATLLFFLAISLLLQYENVVYSVGISAGVFFLMLLYKLAKAVEDETFYRRIPASKLRPGDMLGEDMPKLKLYKKLIRGLTKKEVERIRAAKKRVVVREGVRFGIVFPLALAFTLIYGDIFRIVLLI